MATSKGPVGSLPDDLELAVYILGAGFSAPLGLPVMANFISKAKDQYLVDTKKYGHFKRTFGEFDRLIKAVKFFTSDQFNVEEILSILDMEDYVDINQESGFRELFTRFLCDVIEFHTPEPLGGRGLGGDRHQWPHYIIEGEGPLVNYALFVANILNLKITLEDQLGTTICKLSANSNPARRYAIITLNYDEVLEKVCAGLNRYSNKGRFQFAKGLDPEGRGEYSPFLAKLHGTVSSENIVPPTWSKGKIPPEVERAWGIAGLLLAKATHIRIIGYSLPNSDSYMKYLLKASSLHWYNLKTFDILCLDPAGDVVERYRRLVKFPMRFLSNGTERYLRKLGEYSRSSGSPQEWAYQHLEEAHREIFRHASSIGGRS